MAESSRVIQLRSRAPQDPYLLARARLTDLLIRYGLVDSFLNFVRNGKPYPFPNPRTLLPNTAPYTAELPFQNTALVVCIDGLLPKALNKHFRLRSSNKVTWRNIQRLAPELELSGYKAAHCRFDAEELDALLEKLLPLDYALLAEQVEPGEPLVLTHMHVKVERLTDNAIKALGRDLGYVERGLFERGEDFVETLEAKFFEYYGFSANASGRKSAAAMAAQLLANQRHRFCVFVASQEDARLTLLDDGDCITQYMLIRLGAADLMVLSEAVRHAGREGLDDYVLREAPDEAPVVLYRLHLARTAAAEPGPPVRSDRELLAPWLEIRQEAVLPLPGKDAPEIEMDWAEPLEDL